MATDSSSQPPTQPSESEAEPVDAVRDLIDAAISPSTMNSYINYSANFIRWIADNSLSLIPPDFINALPRQNLNDVFALKRLIRRHDKRIPPLYFDRLTVESIMQYMLQLKRPNGSAPGWSTYNLQRSAITNLFRMYEVEISTSLQSQLRTAFKGLKRQVTDKVQSGHGAIKTGKDPLSFSLFHFLSETALKQEDPSFCFFRLFFLLSWNLCCRSSNVVSICLSHLEWREDALGVFFAHSKSDQLGERPRDPRHIYANPLLPAVCPMLALGIFWLCFPPESDQVKLFLGSSQYDRYIKLFKRLLEIPEAEAELAKWGITKELLGSHSLRKGSATWATSGSTSAPSYSAIALRAGWTLPGVQSTYLRYDAAGDQYVGRTLSGLPQGSPEFAILPPFFPVRDEFIDESIAVAFPSLPPSLHRVGEFLLATLVYHRNYLRGTLPARHLVFSSPLFNDSQRLEQLAQRVACRRANDNDKIRATGLPPHVSIVCELRQLAEEGRSLVPNVVSAIEERVALGTGLDQLAPMMFAELRQLRMLVISGTQSTRLASGSEERAPQELENEIRSIRVFPSADGRLLRLPAGFQLPRGTLGTAWQWWLRGAPDLGITPLRNVKAEDFSILKQRHRFSDLKWICRQIEMLLDQQSVAFDPRAVSTEQASQLLSRSGVLSQFAEPEGSLAARKRRTPTLMWQTQVRRMRRAAKQRRTA